ncbi:hypothetical protein OB905_06260 [Halobacteria archaeon AArc-dxtr1]|nr:hypothetical protein [Halobacteria archaeon AArc-dxtr1]
MEQGDRDRGPIGDQLADLKGDGCNLLVTGNVTQDVTYHATRTLFGASQEGRDRILACTDLEPGANHYLRTGFDADPSVVSANSLHRSVTVTDPTQPGTPPDRALRPFRARVCGRVADAVEARESVGAGQLRLGVLTLRPIVERFERDEGRRFLRVLTTLVDGASGIGHYHLPVADDDALVETYDDLFDARIELRNREGALPEHRWYLPETNQPTDWWPL